MSAEASGSHPTSEHAAHIDAQRPKRHNLTPAEQQAAAVSRLLANPDREIKLPPASKEKELRAPREMIKNVTGSSAGAGSGEFHVYKHARRREYERVKLLEERAEKDKLSSLFLIHQADQAAKDDAKTSKNRAKRDKKKLAKEKARMAASGSQPSSSIKLGAKRQHTNSADDESIGIGDKKMKAAPGSEGMIFQRHDSSDHEDTDI